MDSGVALSPHKFLIVAAIVMALLALGALIENWRDRRRMTLEEQSVARNWIVALGAAFFVFLILCATAFARDPDGRQGQSPSIAVLATICLERCQDVVVTTSEQDPSVTMMWCAIGGQLAITGWLAQNKPGYRLAGWKCVVGDRRRGA